MYIWLNDFEDMKLVVPTNVVLFDQCHSVITLKHILSVIQ